MKKEKPSAQKIEQVMSCQLSVSSQKMTSMVNQTDEDDCFSLTNAIPIFASKNKDTIYDTDEVRSEDLNQVSSRSLIKNAAPNEMNIKNHGMKNLLDNLKMDEIDPPNLKIDEEPNNNIFIESALNCSNKSNQSIVSVEYRTKVSRQVEVRLP